MRGLFILIRAIALQLGGIAKDAAEQIPESEPLSQDYQADILLIDQQEIIEQVEGYEKLTEQAKNRDAGMPSGVDLDSRVF